MNYDEMSDFEINRAVANIAANCHAVRMIGDSTIFNYVELANGVEFNPCNYHSDAWPIILENNIALIPVKIIGGPYRHMACSDVDFNVICMSPDGNDSGAIIFDSKNDSYHKNPFRAAMVVYLKMKAAENE